MPGLLLHYGCSGMALLLGSPRGGQSWEREMGRAMATARAASKASLGNVEDAASTVVSRRDGAHGGGDAAEEEAPRVRPPPRRAAR